MKVFFRKSFVENVEVFLIIRAERNNTHFRIDTCDRSRSAYPYPISIRVWGIVSSIYDQGLSTTFNKMNESQLHTFFVYTSNILLELRNNNRINEIVTLHCIYHLDLFGSYNDWLH